MATVIVAKNPGHCELCDEDYQKGTRIAKDDKSGLWVHADCLFPGRVRKPANNTFSKPYGSSEREEGPPVPYESPTPLQLQRDRVLRIGRAELRLLDAKEIVLKVAPELSGKLELWSLAGEVAHQLYGDEVSDKIQSKKEMR